MEYSMGFFVYYFGTKKVYESVNIIRLSLEINIKNTLMIYLTKKLNNDISYYLHRPSATDKSMAPEGQ